MFSRSLTGGASLVAATVTIVACSHDATGPSGPPKSPFPSVIRLQSDAGDAIGNGATYSYTPENSVLTVTASGGQLSVGVQGDEEWFGDFSTNASQLATGTYTTTASGASAGSLDWEGEGRGCGSVVGSFTIDSLTYAAGALTSIDMSFEQHCDGLNPALRGTIHWRANDPTKPPGPVIPIPASLWQPPSNVLPASGNYFYLQSDQGDYVGEGGTYLYTPANATLGLTASGSHVAVSVDGPAFWSGDFVGMLGLPLLQQGYYPSLQRYPFNNPAKGGLNWDGEGRGCNTLKGWFVVDKVSYSGVTLTALDLRFEQHCEGAAAALHGAIHWTQ